MLTDGSYHEVDSSEAAFKAAAEIAFKEGMKAAKPAILEPYSKLRIGVPEQYLGDVLGDLNKRRGRIIGMDAQDDLQVITAEAPKAPSLAPAPAEEAASAPHATERAPSDREDGVVQPAVCCWRRRKGPVYRQVGHLSDVRGNALYRLTPLGCALWQMLEQPLSEAQAVALLAEAFPQAGRRRIAQDVRALFEALRRHGLIERFFFEEDKTRGGGQAYGLKSEAFQTENVLERV